jgi:hypothetical protein
MEYRSESILNIAANNGVSVRVNIVQIYPAGLGLSDRPHSRAGRLGVGAALRDLGSLSERRAERANAEQIPGPSIFPRPGPAEPSARGRGIRAMLLPSLKARDFSS